MSRARLMRLWKNFVASNYSQDDATFARRLEGVSMCNCVIASFYSDFVLQISSLILDSALRMECVAWQRWLCHSVCDQMSVVVLLWGTFSPNLGILSRIHFAKVAKYFQCRISFSFCHKRDCLCPILTQSNVNNVRWCLLFSRVFVVFWGFVLHSYTHISIFLGKSVSLSFYPYQTLAYSVLARRQTKNWKIPSKPYGHRERHGVREPGRRE